MKRDHVLWASGILLLVTVWVLTFQIGRWTASRSSPETIRQQVRAALDAELAGLDTGDLETRLSVLEKEVRSLVKQAEENKQERAELRAVVGQMATQLNLLKTQFQNLETQQRLEVSP